MGASESREVLSSSSGESSRCTSVSNGESASGDKRSTCSTWSKAISSSRFDDDADDNGSEITNKSKNDNRIAAIYGPIFEVVNGIATIIARGVTEGTLEFVVSNGIDMFRQSVGVTHEHDYVGRVECRGLKAGSTYTISVGGRTGTLRTPPSPTSATAISFVFGSCIGGQGFGRTVDEGWSIFKSAASLSPSFALLLGDNIYSDDSIPIDGGRFKQPAMVPGAENACTADIQSFYARYRYHLADESYSSLLRATPTYVTWDDHEVTDNWCRDKIVELEKKQPGSVAYLDAATKSFLTYWPISRSSSSSATADKNGKSVTMTASSPLSLPVTIEATSATPSSASSSSSDHIYRRFSYGSHCEVFLLDVRSYRSAHQVASTGRPYIRTMLGEQQLSWLKSSVSESKATWKFIVSSVPLSFPTGDFPPQPNPSLDGWAGDGAAEELLAIATHFNQHCVKNYVFLTGDVHFPFTIAYDPFNKGVAEFHEFGASPWAAVPLPPIPHEAISSSALRPRVLYSDGAFNGDLHVYGHIEIDNDATLTFSVRDRNGTIRPSSSLTLKPTPP